MNITLDGPFGWVGYIFLIFGSVITVKIYMMIANALGESMGIGRFILYLCNKIKMLFVKWKSHMKSNKSL